MHESIIKDLWPADKLISCEQQLEYDEKLLNVLDQGYHQGNQAVFLRFWECRDYAVVLGRSNSAESEAFETRCKALDIPVLKRPSGGGTVILGPGCLCYSLYLPNSLAAFSSISSTTTTVMTLHRDALRQALSDVQVQGVSDLCSDAYKFSGNAQRRKKNSSLFHGTFLYDFDLELISNTLKHPSKEPEYRQGKQHKDFIRNIALSASNIQALVSAEWCKRFNTHTQLN